MFRSKCIYSKILFTEDDELYTAGWNNKGQLGLSSDSAEISILTRVPVVAKVQSVSCGWNHTLIVCSKCSCTIWLHYCYYT